MHLICRQSLANEAAQNWKRQYLGARDGLPFDPKAIGEALEALGPNPDPDAVDRVIGGGGFTSVPACDECELDAPAVMEMGDEPDYESSTAHLCLECLVRAAAKLTAALVHSGTAAAQTDR